MRRQCIERELPYSPEQLFDIAADVERYSEFLGGWIAARVRERHAHGYCTEQILGVGPVRIQFVSRTELDRPSRIDVYSDDAAFRRLRISWLFEARPDASCRVSLCVDLQLRSRLLQAILEQVTPDRSAEMMAAFEARARQLYGPPASGFRGR